jgi:hypothetical protein
MPLWYARYNKSDKVVVGRGFLASPSDFADDTHDVSVGFPGEIPALQDAAGNYLKKYNEQTQLLEDNI